jgi:hypothetical protein
VVEKPPPQYKFDRVIVFANSKSLPLNKMFWEVTIEELPITTDVFTRLVIERAIGNKLSKELRMRPFTHQFQGDPKPFNYRVFARVQVGTDPEYLKKDLNKLNSTFEREYKKLEKRQDDGEVLPKQKALLAYEALLDMYDSKVTKRWKYVTTDEYKANGGHTLRGGRRTLQHDSDEEELPSGPENCELSPSQKKQAPLPKRHPAKRNLMKDSPAFSGSDVSPTKKLKVLLPSQVPPGAQSPDPGAQSPDPGAQSPDPSAQSPHPGAQSPDPGAQSLDAAALQAQVERYRVEMEKKQQEADERKKQEEEERLAKEKYEQEQAKELERSKELQRIAEAKELSREKAREERRQFAEELRRKADIMKKSKNLRSQGEFN